MATRSSAIAAAAAAASQRARGRGSGGGAGGGHKERSKNFTELEKRTVLELIAEHRDVLKQGRSNSVTNKNKQLVWSSICEEVNKRCCSDRPRTPAQVKMWYENYKKKCKMRSTDVQDGSSMLDGMLWQNMHPLSGIKDEEPDDIKYEMSNMTDDELPVNMSNGRLSCSETDDASINYLEPHIQIIPQSSPTPPPHQPMQFKPAKPPSPSLTQQMPVPTTTQHNASQHYTNPEHLRLQSSISIMSGPCVVTEPNVPLNLSHLDSSRDAKRPNVGDSNGRVFSGNDSFKCYATDLPNNASKRSRNPWCDNGNTRESCCQTSSSTEEEKLYFLAKRQHAMWEHEAKMKLLNMELKQKEEIFSLQKQLFLIELKLKMDFLEKTCNLGK